LKLNEFKKDLENNNFNFKKKFGQNFIIDENIIKAIVNKAEITKDTLVIEIGIGALSLTKELVKKAGFVLGYEIDETLKELHAEFLKENPNLTIKYTDFLKTDIKEDIKDYKTKNIYVIANLPYYITTPIVQKIINVKQIEKLVIMVQKEVGNRFKAEAGTKEYNSLTIFLNYYFDIKKILDVSKNVFMPKPNVDSIVLELKRKKENIFVKDETLFFNLIRDSFKQKRKTLKNNLTNYDLIKIEKVLKENGFNLNVRAEDLKAEIFAGVANELS
jgi:16S rRNA (adenine1518-N6/adenine1519-N6)-dimethyltransferase